MYDEAFVAAAATAALFPPSDIPALAAATTTTSGSRQVDVKEQKEALAAGLPSQKLFIRTRAGSPPPTPSIAVLESLPHLDVYSTHDRNDEHGHAQPHVLRSLVATLHQGLGPHHLSSLELMSVNLSSPTAMQWLLDALRQAPCAPISDQLILERNALTTAGATVLGTALGEDAFPAMESLYIIENEGIGDEGCVALLEGLRKARQTRLSLLHLEMVEFGNEAMKALARVVEVGNFVLLETLVCSGYHTEPWGFYFTSDVEEEENPVAHGGGVRALIEAVAGGDREGGSRKQAEAQGGSLLPKLLMVHLTVLGRAVTSITLLIVVRTLTRACPLLEGLHSMPSWDHYNDCCDVDDTLKRATDGWVKAANDARSEGEEHLKISFRNGSLGIYSTFYDSDDGA